MMGDADRVRQARKIALRESEKERASLAQELQATAGEKASLSEELSALGLRFAAAQSLWESQLESERENNQALARAAQADRQQACLPKTVHLHPHWWR